MHYQNCRSLFCVLLSASNSTLWWPAIPIIEMTVDNPYTNNRIKYHRGPGVARATRFPVLQFPASSKSQFELNNAFDCHKNGRSPVFIVRSIRGLHAQQMHFFYFSFSHVSVFCLGPKAKRVWPRPLPRQVNKIEIILCSKTDEKSLAI